MNILPSVLILILIILTIYSCYVGLHEYYFTNNDLCNVIFPEGQIPKGAIYMGTRETVDGDVKHLDTFYLLPEEKTVTTRVIEKKAPKVEGIGPKEEGVPTALKTVSSAGAIETLKVLLYC